MVLGRIPSVVLNLKRRPDRRRHALRMLRSVGFEPVLLRAFDGSELEAAGGRCTRPRGKGPYTLCWDDGKERRSSLLSAESGIRRRIAKPWHTLGCKLSHEN